MYRLRPRTLDWTLKGAGGSSIGAKASKFCMEHHQLSGFYDLLKYFGWVHRLGLKLSRQGAYPRTPHAVLGFLFGFWGLEGPRGLRFWCLGSQKKAYGSKNQMQAKTLGVQGGLEMHKNHAKPIFWTKITPTTMNKIQKICFFHWNIEMGPNNEGPLTPSQGQPNLKMGAYFSPMTCGRDLTIYLYPSNCIVKIFYFSWKVQILVPRLGYPPFQVEL